MKVFNIKASDLVKVDDPDLFKLRGRRLLVAYIVFLFILFVINQDYDKTPNIESSNETNVETHEVFAAPEEIKEDSGNKNEVLDIEEAVLGKDDQVTTPEESSVIPLEISTYTFGYDGGRIGETFLNSLWSACEYDVKRTKLVVAMSIAESGMGSKGLAATKNTNFWNIFVGGNRAYDPDMDTMSMKACNLVRDSYWEVDTSFHQAKSYTKGYNFDCTGATCIAEVNNWMRNINASLNGMNK